MSGNANNSPMLKAAGLWAKTSVKGGQYLTGRLGEVKVLVLENRDRQGDDDPSHHLFFAEAPPRQGAQERGEGPDHPGRARRHQQCPGAASRHKPAWLVTTCRRGSAEHGEEGTEQVSSREAGSSAGDGAGPHGTRACRGPGLCRAEEGPAPSPALLGGSPGGR